MFVRRNYHDVEVVEIVIRRRVICNVNAGNDVQIAALDLFVVKRLQLVKNVVDAENQSFVRH